MLLGINVGKIFKPEHFLHVDLQAGAYYNVEKPELTGADWSLRRSATFLIPTAFFFFNEKGKGIGDRFSNTLFQILSLLKPTFRLTPLSAVHLSSWHHQCKGRQPRLRCLLLRRPCRVQ